MAHPALVAESVAVVTGGASGIGLAAAKVFARLGMRVVLVDVRRALLDDAAKSVRTEGAAEVLTFDTDVSDRAAVETLEREVADRFGGTDILSRASVTSREGEKIRTVWVNGERLSNSSGTSTLPPACVQSSCGSRRTEMLPGSETLKE